MVTVKVSITDMCGLAPLQVRERVVMDTHFYQEMYGDFCLTLFRNLNKKILKFLNKIKHCYN